MSESVDDASITALVKTTLKSGSKVNLKIICKLIGGSEERVLLPAAYVMTIVFREKDRQRIDSILPDLIKNCQAEILSDKIARREWDNRFGIMVVKRLGPSLVPVEVVIPLASLGDVMAEVDRKVSQPVVKEGLIILEGAGGNPEVAILGFIKLLSPQGFAGLIGTMWPELIDAMPLGMGGMMRLLGKVPGTLSLMQPMIEYLQEKS